MTLKYNVHVAYKNRNGLARRRWLQGRCGGRRPDDEVLAGLPADRSREVRHQPRLQHAQSAPARAGTDERRLPQPHARQRAALVQRRVGQVRVYSYSSEAALIL